MRKSPSPRQALNYAGGILGLMAVSSVLPYVDRTGPRPDQAVQVPEAIHYAGQLPYNTGSFVVVPKFPLDQYFICNPECAKVREVPRDFYQTDHWREIKNPLAQYGIRHARLGD